MAGRGRALNETFGETLDRLAIASALEKARREDELFDARLPGKKLLYSDQEIGEVYDELVREGLLNP
jgi:hypothetical protein